jgi:hypothetical protein
VVRAYIDAFNARDIEAFERTLHFPNARHADGRLVLLDAPTGDARILAMLEARIGWHHTSLDSAEVVQQGPGKVHVAVRVTRRRADASPIHAFDSLYVVTHEEGRWAIKIKSSYAPERLEG